LSIDKLRSLQEELHEQIILIENGLSYEKISAQVSQGSFELEKEESALDSLLRQKGKVQFQLNEIEEFASYTDESETVTAKELQIFFNRYVSGLGDFVQKDLNELQKFRQEISVFESEMVAEQKDGLKNRLDTLKGEISFIEEKIKKYRLLIDDGRNHLQKGLRMSTSLINDFNENGKILEDYDDFQQNVREVTASFQSLYSELEKEFFPFYEKEESFRKTFLEIHEKVYGDKSGVFGFDLSTGRSIKDKEFFKIKAQASRQGSEGVNRVRQVIFDLSLMVNHFTSPKSHGLIVHDRLLFGDIDNDATFNILNYINSLSADTFQYIATYNSDVMSTETANQELTFDIESRAVVNLSVDEPLFFKQFKQNIDYQEKPDYPTEIE
jgi:hypothetical protein